MAKTFVKKVFSNSLYILSYEFFKEKWCSEQDFQHLFSRSCLRGKTCFTPKTLFLDTEIIPKAAPDPQMIYEAVFKYHTIFQEKLSSLGFNHQLD